MWLTVFDEFITFLFFKLTAANMSSKSLSGRIKREEAWELCLADRMGERLLGFREGATRAKVRDLSTETR